MAMKIYMNQRYHQKAQYGSNSRNSQSKENVIKKNNKHRPDKKKVQEKTPGDHYFSWLFSSIPKRIGVIR